MSILVDEGTRVLIQGITGSTGGRFAERMLAGGTAVVGGVTPGKAGTTVAGLPVFDSMREAVEATGADAALCVVRPDRALDAVYEIVDARLGLAVVYVENIAVHDALRMCVYAEAWGTRLLGPNSAGVVSPGRANLSDLDDANLRAGSVGVVSKSGTLTYEVIDGLTGHGLGTSTVVCLGGDQVIGIDYVDVLRMFEDDRNTDVVVVVGEPGGDLEHAAAEFTRTMSTPVVAYITGQCSPQGARMGHAGAIVRSDTRSTPASKIAAFTATGRTVASRVTDIGDLVAAQYATLDR